jgi:hypothetical protein
MSIIESLRKEAAAEGRPDWFRVLRPRIYGQFVGEDEWLSYHSNGTISTFLLLVAEALEAV